MIGIGDSYLKPLSVADVMLRPVPTGPSCHQLIAIVGHFPLAASSWFRISNMFNKGSRPPFLELVVELVDSVLE